MIDKDNPEWTKDDFRQAKRAAEALPKELLDVLPKRRQGARGAQKTPTADLNFVNDHAIPS